MIGYSCPAWSDIAPEPPPKFQLSIINWLSIHNLTPSSAAGRRKVMLPVTGMSTNPDHLMEKLNFNWRGKVVAVISPATVKSITLSTPDPINELKEVPVK